MHSPRVEANESSHATWPRDRDAKESISLLPGPRESQVVNPLPLTPPTGHRGRRAAHAGCPNKRGCAAPDRTRRRALYLFSRALRDRYICPREWVSGAGQECESIKRPQHHPVLCRITPPGPATTRKPFRARHRWPSDCAGRRKLAASNEYKAARDADLMRILSPAPPAGLSAPRRSSRDSQAVWHVREQIAHTHLTLGAPLGPID